MKRLKVMTVVGTRPEIIRLSVIIQKLDKSPAFEHVLIHTGQNYDYELNEVFFEDLGIRKPDHFLNAAGQNATQTIGNVINAIDHYLTVEKPEAFLVLGDTNSSLCAIPAKKQKIPIFHMEAGNRCFDQRVPEEINRKIVDHISDINLPYSNIARSYLLREGLPPDQVIKTGSPMKEVLDHYMDKILSSDVLMKLNLEKNQYFVVSTHRAENIEPDKNFFKIFDLLNSIAENYDLPVIVSTHPRTMKRVEKSQLEFHKQVRLLKPLGFTEYVHLQMNAKAVISDSGTISEESSILNFPALNLREAHERPEAMEEGAVMMTGLEKERVFQGLSLLDSQPRSNNRLLQITSDYNIPNVSEKVLRIILSYTDYINHTVWNK